MTILLSQQNKPQPQHRELVSAEQDGPTESRRQMADFGIQEQLGSVGQESYVVMTKSWAVHGWCKHFWGVAQSSCCGVEMRTEVLEVEQRWRMLLEFHVMPQCKAFLILCLDLWLPVDTPERLDLKVSMISHCKIHSRSTLKKRKTQGCTHRIKWASYLVTAKIRIIILQREKNQNLQSKLYTQSGIPSEIIKVQRT